MNQNGTSDHPLNSPQAAKLLKNKDAMNAMLNSPEGKRLAQMLQQSSGDLQGAANSASGGDLSAVANLFAQLKNNPEGMALLARLAEQMPK